MEERCFTFATNDDATIEDDPSGSLSKCNYYLPFRIWVKGAAFSLGVLFLTLYVALYAHPGVDTAKPDALSLAQSQPLIHFMFLAVDDVPHANIWKEFFAAAPEGSHSIWLHCKDADACQKSDIVDLPGLNIVSTVQSLWCGDLVTAPVHMIKAALGANVARHSAIDKFVLISDSTLPIKPFEEIYDILSNTNRSDFCLYPTYAWSSSGTGVLNTSWLVMAHQWFVLTRQDAEDLASYWIPPNLTSPYPDHQYYHPFRIPLRGARWSTEEETVTSDSFPDAWGCPDELAVFASLYGVIPSGNDTSYDVRGFGEVDMWANEMQGRCRTLVAWSYEPIVQDLLFSDSASNANWVRNSTNKEPGIIESLGEDVMTRLRASPFLFVRRVSANASLPNFSAFVLS